MNINNDDANMGDPLEGFPPPYPPYGAGLGMGLGQGAEPQVGETEEEKKEERLERKIGYVIKGLRKGRNVALVNQALWILIP